LINLSTDLLLMIGLQIFSIYNRYIFPGVINTQIG